MKKSTKRFVISTETQNNLGFKVRTSGIDLTQFNKNPLLLWMHKRPKGERKDEILPLGYWEDLKVDEKGHLTGVPVFDEDDEFAMSIFNKVENGTIKMASAGLNPVEWKEDEDGNWLEKSIALEASLCDIGSNPDALAVVLYDENDNVITLSQDYLSKVLPPKKSDMKKLEVSPSVLPLIKLTDGATPQEVEEKIKEIVTLANSQASQIITLKNEKEAEVKLKEKAEADLVQLKTDQDKAQKKALLDQAINVDRKITEDQREDFVKLSLDHAKSILDKMPANPTAEEQFKEGSKKAKQKYVELSWKELDKKGMLISLKNEDFGLFKAKFEEEFGKEYKG